MNDPVFLTVREGCRIFEGSAYNRLSVCREERPSGSSRWPPNRIEPYAHHQIQVRKSSFFLPPSNQDLEGRKPPI